MASDIDPNDDMKELLRQVVASNLTVAYQLEQLKRSQHPGDERVHPLAQVLEVFEMIQEVMDPSDEEDELEGEGLDADGLDDDEGELEVGESKRTSATLQGTPFESTMRYLRPKRRGPR